MSDNWIVPSADPNIPNGVDHIIAATPNVTITGSTINPAVGVTQGGVLTVENVTGNVNLNGVGMTIVGGTPVANDITLTAAVQNVVSGGVGCSVVQNPAGTYTISFT